MILASITVRLHLLSTLIERAHLKYVGQQEEEREEET